MSRNPFRKTVGFYEVMATSYTDSGNPSERTSFPPPAMESYRSTSPPSAIRQSSIEDASNRNHVNFKIKDREAEKERKTRYLTAKYGQHQMMLIRKRLAVEDWLYEQLRTLYNCQEDEEDHDCKLELEEVLNLDTDEERRKYAMDSLTETLQPQEVLVAFVEELLKKAKTL